MSAFPADFFFQFQTRRVVCDRLFLTPTGPLSYVNSIREFRLNSMINNKPEAFILYSRAKNSAKEKEQKRSRKNERGPNTKTKGKDQMQTTNAEENKRKEKRKRSPCLFLWVNSANQTTFLAKSYPIFKSPSKNKLV